MSDSNEPRIAPHKLELASAMRKYAESYQNSSIPPEESAIKRFFLEKIDSIADAHGVIVTEEELGPLLTVAVTVVRTTHTALRLRD